MDEPVVAGIVFLIGVVLATVGAVRAPAITFTSSGFLTIIVAVLFVRSPVGPIGAVALGFVGIFLIALAALVQAVRNLTEEAHGLRQELLGAGLRRAVTDPIELDIGAALTRETRQHR